MPGFWPWPFLFLTRSVFLLMITWCGHGLWANLAEEGHTVLTVIQADWMFPDCTPQPI